MKIEVEWNDILEQIIEDCRFRQIVYTMTESYFIKNKNISEAVENKIINSIQSVIPKDLNQKLNEEFTKAIVQVEFKHTSNIHMMESKIENMSKNMDALYAEIQALKNDRSHST